jgi:hypothetical protein
MTDPAAQQPLDPLIVPDESVFSFEPTDWTDPPLFLTELPETSPETNIRILGEKEYRDSTNPTNWQRFLVLGRYAVDGFTFDNIIYGSGCLPIDRQTNWAQLLVLVDLYMYWVSQCRFWSLKCSN